MLMRRRMQTVRVCLTVGFIVPIISIERKRPEQTCHNIHNDVTCVQCAQLGFWWQRWEKNKFDGPFQEKNNQNYVSRRQSKTKVKKDTHLLKSENCTKVKYWKLKPKSLDVEQCILIDFWSPSFLNNEFQVEKSSWKWKTNEHTTFTWKFHCVFFNRILGIHFFLMQSSNKEQNQIGSAHFTISIWF